MYLQRWHGWCHRRLLPSRRVVLCTPYNHAPYHFMQSHVRKLHACLAVTCHLHLGQNGRDSFTCYCGNTGVDGYRNESAQKVDPGEENSPAASASGSFILEIRTGIFSKSVTLWTPLQIPTDHTNPQYTSVHKIYKTKYPVSRIGGVEGIHLS